MRLRCGVLAVGLMFLTMTGAPGAVAAETVDGAADPLPTIEAPTQPAETVAPEPELTPVHVAVWLCDDAKCPTPAEIVSGVAVSTVDSTTNQVVAGCVTAGDPAGCSLGVPAYSEWTFAWDDSTIPAGYVFDSVAVVTGGGWEGEAYIIQFVPAPAEPQLETVHVGVMLCDSADCAADGELLAGVGVASVDTDTNAQVDNCETAGDPAVCEIDVPLNAPWTFTWDFTAIPEGYHSIGEPSVVEGGAYPTVYLIRLVPDAGPTHVPTVTPVAIATAAPVTGLPKTGAGEPSLVSGTAGAVILMASALGLAGLGIIARRRRPA